MLKVLGIIIFILSGNLFAQEVSINHKNSIENKGSILSDNGLVAYFPFNGNANDESGNGNNGIVTGAQLSSDRLGNTNSAFSFNYEGKLWGELNNEIYVPFDPSFNSELITVSCWVYPRSYFYPSDSNNPNSAIIRRAQYGYSTPNGQTWGIDFNSNSITGFILSQEQNSSIALYETPLELNSWTHIAMSYNGSEHKLYINGVLKVIENSTISINVAGNSGISIGVSNQSNGYWMDSDAIIDDVGFWNRVLTPEEVANLHSTNSNASGNNTNVAYSWELKVDSIQLTNRTANFKVFGYDKIRNRIYSIYKGTTNNDTDAFYVDMQQNNVVDLNITSWPSTDLYDFAIDSDNNRLLVWRSGRDNIYSVSTEGGIFTQFGSGSFDSGSYGSSPYYNSLTNSVGYYGGYGGFQLKNWIFENGGSTWIEKKPNLTDNFIPKGGRIWASNANRTKIYRISGQGSYDGNQSSQSCSTGDSPWAADVGVYCWLRDIWEINLEDYSFKNLLPVGRNGIPREGAFTYDYDTNTFYLIGGFIPTGDNSVNINNYGNSWSMQVYKFQPDVDDEFVEIAMNGDLPPISNNELGVGMAYYDSQNKRIIYARKQGVWTFPTTTSTSNSEDTFVVGINTSIENSSATSSLGVSPDATESLDEELDTPLPPSPQGDFVELFFNHPEWNGLLTDAYKDDIRLSTDISALPKKWNLSLVSTQTASDTLFVTVLQSFPWPILVRQESGDYSVHKNGSFYELYDVVADDTLKFTFEVGDTTVPVVTMNADMIGPKVWSSELERQLTWSVEELNQVDQTNLSYSFDNGATWELVTDNGENAHLWQAENVAIGIYPLKFKLVSNDIVGNQSEIESREHITLVTPWQKMEHNAGWTLAGSSFSESTTNESVLSNAYHFVLNDGLYERVSAYPRTKGVWIGAYEAAVDSIQGAISETNETIVLNQGWNLISSPLFSVVRLDSAQVTYNDKTLPFIVAIDSSWVTQPLAYTSNEYAQVSELSPQKGYWLGILKEQVSISLPIHSVVQNVAKGIQSQESKLIVKIEDNGMNHSVELAFSELEKDIPAPPALPNGNRFALQGEETVLGSAYMQRVLHSEEESQVPLLVSGSKREVNLTWDSQNLDLYEVKLITSTNDELTLENNGSITINSDDLKGYLKVVPRTTSAEELSTKVYQYELEQNYPNPFNPSTSISFSLKDASSVSIQVFDMMGREIKTLLKQKLTAGKHTVQFDASGLSSGVYLYRMTTNSITLTKKMLLIK